MKNSAGSSIVMTISVLYANILIYLYKKFFIIVKVVGFSMEPTFIEGDKLIVLKIFRHTWLKRNTIVVCKVPQTDNISELLVIKRITGLPGDIIKIYSESINPELVDTSSFDCDGVRYYEIPRRSVYLSSDGYGIDSRIWGAIPLDSVFGIVLIKI